MRSSFSRAVHQLLAHHGDAYDTVLATTAAAAAFPGALEGEASEPQSAGIAMCECAIYYFLAPNH